MKEDDMDEHFICELNLALIPETELASQHICLSKMMARRYRPVIQLSGVTPRVAFAPHITLYQVPVPVQDLPEMQAALLAIAAKTQSFSLKATEYGANSDEGSFEVRYEAPSRLMELQDDTIAAVNPLRGSLLLERDPAGNPMSKRIDESGTAGDNIRRTGFDAVGDPAQGGLFRPHVTLNWFEAGTAVEIGGEALPSLSQFDGTFAKLGIFVLGPCGTCAQRLGALDLAGD
jgi:hypothetical protein